MSDNDIIQGMRAFDAKVTEEYFYFFCAQAYFSFDRRYGLSSKSGLDFYSLAHEYYIQLAQEKFASLDRRPKGMSLHNWMFGAFRYVILNALRSYNREYESIHLVEPEQLQAQIAANPSDRLLDNIANEIEKTYHDKLMGKIADMLFVQGFKQKEIAETLGITPSAVSQRVKRMMEEVVIPYVYMNYPDGLQNEFAPPKSGRFDGACEDEIRYRLPTKEEILDRHSYRITPDVITALSENQIFVYGSSLPMLPKDASVLAAMHFGAEDGHQLGPQGSTYAIPVFDGGMETLRQHVLDFIHYAQQHPKQQFLVTEMGCGIAGYQLRHVAMMFDPATSVPNICLPASFWTALFC